VPPIIIAMINSMKMLETYDLSSVREVFSGAAPLSIEACQGLLKFFPQWKIRQAYGMTETATVVSCTRGSDILLGSSGPLIPGVEARILSIADGSEVTGYGVPGELLLRSPSITTLGYLDNAKATAETFGVGGDGWLRTGDEAMFEVGHKGEPHLFIIDRIKELIKVKASTPP
jgi:long-subunit acyl-CoA synthetase (AMP-forming)